MGVISTRTHGIIDYAFGALLILSPYLFGFATGGPAQWLPMFIGAAILVMSLITNYEYSLIKLVPLPVHLVIDVLGGILLVISPWLFEFSNTVVWPHVVLGIVEIGTAAMTNWRTATAPAISGTNRGGG